MNNYNIFLIRFGLNPNNFKQQEVNPIKTDTGYLYYLEQSKSQVECPFCQRAKLYVKGYYETKINVTINSNETDILLIKRIRYTCRYCNKSFSPKLERIDPYSNISNLVKSNITNDFFKKNTFKEIAERYNVTTSYVLQLFDSTFPYVPRVELSEIVCIDEFHFSKVYDQTYCCLLCDFNNKKIIDVIKNRQKAYLDEYFSRISSIELSNVRYYISDMYDEYRTIKKKYFPDAVHIIDLFHIITQSVDAVDRLRVLAMKNSVEIYSMEYNFMKKNWQSFLCRSNAIPNKTYTYMKTGECYSYFDLVYRCVKKDDALSIGYGVL